MSFNFLVIVTAWIGGVSIIVCTLYLCLKRSELTAAQAVALGVGAALIALSFLNIAKLVEENIRKTIQEQLPQIAREVAEEFFRRQSK